MSLYDEDWQDGELNDGESPLESVTDGGERHIMDCLLIETLLEST